MKSILGSLANEYISSYNKQYVGEVLVELQEFNSNLADGNMQITPNEGRFISTLANLIKAENYLEIGTFTGYSALSMALNTNAHIYTVDKNEKTTNIAKDFWEKADVSHKITAYTGIATVILQELLQTNSEYFDMIFIDANKSEYPAYYDISYKLLKSGGVILVDNAFFHGEVFKDECTGMAAHIKELNNIANLDDRVHNVLLPIADGINLIHKK